MLRSQIAFQLATAWHPACALDFLARNGDAHAALGSCPPSWHPSPRAVERALVAARRSKAVAVPFGSDAYPAWLARLGDAPPLLWVQGRVEVLGLPGVAIVGARAPSAYGLRTARELAFDLARAGVVVISGLALGVDAAAHRGALEAGGNTVAVQGCGADRIYPARHRRLAEEIAASGAVVSEFPPATPPLPPHFPLRNRTISGLARAVVVVEARPRSGSLITARHALDQGIEVLAVPGATDVATSSGPNALIRDGAAPVLESADVLRALGIATPLAARSKPDAVRAARPPAQLELLAALDHAPAEPDELARRLRRSPESLALDLLDLELAGAVARDRDGRLRTSSK